jgi:hypothetical protein
MVHGQPYKGLQKIPHILVLIIHHQNYEHDTRTYNQ